MKPRLPTFVQVDEVSLGIAARQMLEQQRRPPLSFALERRIEAFIDGDVDRACIVHDAIEGLLVTLERASFGSFAKAATRLAKKWRPLNLRTDGDPRAVAPRSRR